ncbi:hypothetical protein ACPPVO_23750 [Dactylosporangium sp. McL0621]|uniref:hypothetical protein n=1 Tax=Dactylosporangium sp. McL0621 TaxID=3415678 RepID=UPI003CF79D8D
MTPSTASPPTPILASIDHTRHEARLAYRNDDGDPTWMIRCTADTPTAVQQILLYTVLSAHLGDATAILPRIADLLHLPQNPT